VYAVIRTGSKQYIVEKGQELLVEKMKDAEPGKKIEINDVLMWADGDSLLVGKGLPVTVQCTCIGNEKGKKLRTFKYKHRKNYQKTIGHRQTYTRLVVDNIEKRGD